MGLFSNRVGRDELKPGDHIYSWRTAYVYSHHGIYVGDNMVVHFTRGQEQEVGTGTVLDIILTSSVPKRSEVPCPICNQHEEGNGVVSSCLDCFLTGGVLYRFEYSVNPALFLAKARGGTCTLAVSDPDEIVLQRAMHLLNNGFGCYNVFKNNCEDFAIYCKTGLLVVDQGIIGRSGQAVSIIGGPLAAILSTPLRLFTTNVYGLAATAVTVYCTSRFAADIGNRRDAIKVNVEDLTSRLATGGINVDTNLAPPHAQRRISTANLRGPDLQALLTGFELGSTLYADLLLAEGDFLLLSDALHQLGTFSWDLMVSRKKEKSHPSTVVFKTLEAQFSDSPSSANRIADSRQTWSAYGYDRQQHMQHSLPSHVSRAFIINIHCSAMYPGDVYYQHSYSHLVQHHADFAATTPANPQGHFREAK